MNKERNEKTNHYILGDEVYKIGSKDPKEPFGKVVSVGEKMVYVKKYSNNKKVPVSPNNLYLGYEWQKINNLNKYSKGGKLSTSKIKISLIFK